MNSLLHSDTISPRTTHHSQPLHSFLSLHLKPPALQIILNNLITPPPNFILLFLIPLPPPSQHPRSLESTPRQSLPLKNQTPTLLRPCHQRWSTKAKNVIGMSSWIRYFIPRAAHSSSPNLTHAAHTDAHSLLFTFAPWLMHAPLHWTELFLNSSMLHYLILEWSLY